MNNIEIPFPTNGKSVIIITRDIARQIVALAEMHNLPVASPACSSCVHEELCKEHGVNLGPAECGDEYRAKPAQPSGSVDPTDAPPGYYAEAREGCDGCAFAAPGTQACNIGPSQTCCVPEARDDGCSVIFHKKEDKPSGPPLVITNPRAFDLIIQGAAKPSGDDAAVVEAMAYIIDNSPGNTMRSGCAALLAAIRAGKVPTVYTDSPPLVCGYDDAMREKDVEISALRAKLAEAEAAYDVQHKAHVAARAKLALHAGDVQSLNSEIEQMRRNAEDNAAQVAELTRERDSYRKAKSENDERFMTERDSARAEAALWKERAEKAEGELFAEKCTRDAHTEAAMWETTAKLNAARAEAEAAKAELHVTKQSVAEWHADAERLAKDLGDAVRLLRTAGDDFLTLQETAWDDNSDIQGYQYSEISEEIEAFLTRIAQEKKP